MEFRAVCLVEKFCGCFVGWCMFSLYFGDLELFTAKSVGFMFLST